MAETKIEWADYTANTHRGCSKVHAGCQHCYAETLANRFPATFGRWGTEKQGGARVVADLDKLFRDVKRWDQKAQCNCRANPMSAGRQSHPSTHMPGCPQAESPTIVFWNDVSDTFEDWRGPLVDREGNKFGWTGERMKALIGKSPNLTGIHRMATLSDVRRRMFAEGIDANQNLTHLLLTKRPENVPGMWPAVNWHACESGDCPHDLQSECDADPSRYERDNVWLGYSASDQATLEAGLPHLLACRDLVPVIGLSLEPLTGPVDLRDYLMFFVQESTGPFVQPWVIVGGESGPRARPCNVEWIRSIVSQCKAAQVPCFVKQLGANAITTDEDPLPEEQVDGNGTSHWFTLGYIKHPKGGDPSEWPEDLRVQEFPTGDDVK